MLDRSCDESLEGVSCILRFSESRKTAYNEHHGTPAEKRVPPIAAPRLHHTLHKTTVNTQVMFPTLS